MYPNGGGSSSTRSMNEWMNEQKMRHTLLAIMAVVCVSVWVCVKVLISITNAHAHSICHWDSNQQCGLSSIALHTNTLTQHHHHCHYRLSLSRSNSKWKWKWKPIGENNNNTSALATWKKLITLCDKREETASFIHFSSSAYLEQNRKLLQKHIEFNWNNKFLAWRKARFQWDTEPSTL